MRIHNLYTDAKGESHFRDIEVEWAEDGERGKKNREAHHRRHEPPKPGAQGSDYCGWLCCTHAMASISLASNSGRLLLNRWLAASITQSRFGSEARARIRCVSESGTNSSCVDCSRASGSGATAATRAAELNPGSLGGRWVR